MSDERLDGFGQRLVGILNDNMLDTDEMFEALYKLASEMRWAANTTPPATSASGAAEPGNVVRWTLRRVGDDISLTARQMRLLLILRDSTEAWTDGQQIHYTHKSGFNLYTDILSGQEFQDLGNIGFVARDDRRKLWLTALAVEWLNRNATVTP